MPAPVIPNLEFIQIITAFAAIVTIIAGIIGFIRGLKGAARKSSFLKELLLILYGMIIVFFSLVAANPDFDLIYIYFIISVFAFGPLIAYKIYLIGRKNWVLLLFIAIPVILVYQYW